MDTGISHVFPGANERVQAVFKRQSGTSNSNQKKSASGEKH
jgi:hypothetical protein